MRSHGALLDPKYGRCAHASETRHALASETQALSLSTKFSRVHLEASLQMTTHVQDRSWVGRRRSPGNPLQLSQFVWWLTAAPFIYGMRGGLNAGWARRMPLVEAYAEAERLCEKAEWLVDECTERSRPSNDLEKAEQALAHELRKRQRALDAIMAAGLERRCVPPENPRDLEYPYGAHLDRRARQMYGWLLRAGARRPRRIRVCEDCWVVFATRSKAVADRCPSCHKSPRPSRPDREVWHHATGVRQTYDRRGDPLGWVVEYSTECQSCGLVFTAARRDKRFCSPGCRVRAHRSDASRDPEQ
jgi:predicted Zn-ribbon and HTH transcriptional regulator